MGTGLLLLAACLPFPAAAGDGADAGGREWLAGDHHVHSEWSVQWDETTSPPTPIRGGDSPYSRTDNAREAARYGLAWMVHTDHDGPGHSKVTRDHACPAVAEARRAVPGVLQFNGMEFGVPAGEHATVIVPPSADECDRLVAIERDFSREEPLREADKRNRGEDMLAALSAMAALPDTPLMFINHPSRTAKGVGAWGAVTPQELRAWQDAAPRVLVGMEGAPGHQATSTDRRGYYRNAAAPTFGGFDQMVAQVGGAWDAMLAEGRRFWITATSDSHRNHRIGGGDFFPGEYSKTWVQARRDHAGILDALREGRIFVATGDLVDRVELTVSDASDASRSATMGGALSLAEGATMRVQLRVRQPTAANAHGEHPVLQRMSVIVGSRGDGTSPRMQVKHFTAKDWRVDGAWRSVSWELPVPTGGAFVRARGSSTDEATPAADTPGEDPWRDLAFYANPVFVDTTRR